MGQDDYKYWAFISYSHQDKAWGDWLHKALETYRVPRRLVGRASRDGAVPRRLFPVFRDREELPTSADLGANIAEALTASRYLVVVCSPRSAVSRWVNEEVRTFKRLGREDRILCLIVDGEPNASDQPHSGLLECFPEAVRHRVDAQGRVTPERTEPIAADGREGRDGKAEARQKILAGLLGVGYDELRQREKQRRLRRRVQGAAAGLVVLGAIGGVWSWQEGQKAQQARLAAAERQTEMGRHELLARHPFRAAVHLGAAYSGGDRSPVLRQLLADALSFLEGQTTLSGHRAPVHLAALSPDGARLVTASDDNVATLWDTARGTPVGSLAGHDGWIWSASFSPDGKLVVTGGVDKTARVWDAASGRLFRTLSGHTAAVRSATFSPDGSRIITASEDGTARIWDATRGLVGTLAGDRGDWAYAEFNADATRILTATSASARLWDGASGRLLAVLENKDRHSYYGVRVTSARFSPDGRRVVTAGIGQPVTIWEASRGQRVRVLADDVRAPFWARFGSDGGYTVLTWGGRGSAALWEVDTGRVLTSFEGHAGNVRDAALSPGDSQVVTAGDDGTVRIWNAKDGSPVVVLEGHQGRVNAAAFGPDAEWVVSAGDDQTVRRWKATENRTLAMRGPRWTAFHGFLADGRLLAQTSGGTHLWDPATGEAIATIVPGPPDAKAIVSRDGTGFITLSARAARLWDGIGGAPGAPLDGHEVVSSAFSADGQRVVTGGADGSVRIWDRSGALVASGVALPGPVTRASLSAGGRRLVAAGAEGRAVLWDVASGKPVAGLAGPDDAAPPDGVEFNRSGSRILTVVDGKKPARLWDATDGRLIASLEDGAARAGIFSPDGRRVATIASGSYPSRPGADRVARLWDAENGQPLAALEGHSGGISLIRFNEEGTRVATASVDHTVKVWDGRSGTLLASLAGHRAWIHGLHFSRDGTRLVTAAQDDTVKIWDTATGNLLGSSHGFNPMAAIFDGEGRRVLVYDFTYPGNAPRARIWDVGSEARDPAEIARIVGCRAPWRLADGKLVPATPDPATCPPRAAAAR